MAGHDHEGRQPAFTSGRTHVDPPTPGIVMADVQSLFFLARMATYVIARRNTDTSMTFRTAWWLTWGDFLYLPEGGIFSAFRMRHLISQKFHTGA